MIFFRFLAFTGLIILMLTGIFLLGFLKSPKPLVEIRTILYFASAGVIFLAVGAWKLLSYIKPVDFESIKNNGVLAPLEFRSSRYLNLWRSLLFGFLLLVSILPIFFNEKLSGDRQFIIILIYAFGWYRYALFLRRQFSSRPPYLILSSTKISYWQGNGPVRNILWNDIGQLCFLYRGSTGDYGKPITSNTLMCEANILEVSRNGASETRTALLSQFFTGGVGGSSNVFQIWLDQFGNSYEVAEKIKAYVHLIGQGSKFNFNA